jgi:hypothetical protein
MRVPGGVSRGVPRGDSGGGRREPVPGGGPGGFAVAWWVGYQLDTSWIPVGYQLETQLETQLGTSLLRCSLKSALCTCVSNELNKRRPCQFCVATRIS